MWSFRDIFFYISRAPQAVVQNGGIPPGPVDGETAFWLGNISATYLFICTLVCTLTLAVIVSNYCDQQVGQLRGRIEDMERLHLKYVLINPEDGLKEKELTKILYENRKHFSQEIEQLYLKDIVKEVHILEKLKKQGIIFDNEKCSLNSEHYKYLEKFINEAIDKRMSLLEQNPVVEQSEPLVKSMSLDLLNVFGYEYTHVFNSLIDCVTLNNFFIVFCILLCLKFFTKNK